MIKENYQKVLDNIRVEIGKISEKYATKGQLTYAEMSKYNRLTSLQKSVAYELNTLYSRNGSLTEIMAGIEYSESFYHHYYQINKSAGVDINFGLLSPEQIKAAVENPLNKIALDGLKVNGLSGIKRVITQGLIQGSSYQKMMKEIEQFFESDYSRAERIVRTEGQRAAVKGSQAVYDDLEQKGVNIFQIWGSTLDDRTRADHQFLDGKKKSENGWYVPGIGWVEGPLQSGVAEFDINCRCTVYPEIEGFPAKYRRIKGEGIKKYVDYNTYAKERGIKQYGVRTVRVKR